MRGAGLVTLTAEELAGDLPLVCARTGRPAESLAPVWFARSPAWAWAPLAALAVWAAVRTDWGPLASWWTAGALLLPLVTSRGVTGRVPLDTTTRQRIAHLRTRRLGVIVAALLLTWVAITLRLIGSSAAGFVVLAMVVGLYVAAVGMFLAGRLLTVRGWPEPDGGATLRDVHPDFAAAVARRRTGHQP